MIERLYIIYMSSSLSLTILLVYHNNIIVHSPMCVCVYIYTYTVCKDTMEGGEMSQS